MNELEFNEVEEVVELVMNDYNQKRELDVMTMFHQPDKTKVVEIVNKLLRIIFPGFYRDEVYKIFNMRHSLSALVEDVMYNMQKQIVIALKNDPKYESMNEGELRKVAKDITLQFFTQIPRIRSFIDTDIQATFDGDPAATSKNEIVLSYPGILASTVHRISHVLWELNVPLIPRMMSEYVHSETGIDIHPAATIGKYFFIDHGTGIVVGSTTNIGEHVKIYQGVTLGALSTSAGQRLHGVKRHPTIEDNVTIYSGASVLGGKTVIGHDSIIGANAFVTSSIKNQELHMGKDKIEKEELPQDDTWFYVI